MKNLSEEQLLAKLRFYVDQATLEQAKKAIEAVEKGLGKDALKAEEARKKLMALRESAEKLQQVGTTLGVTGAAILAPFLLASRTYTQTIGQGEAISRRWMNSTERLKDAQIRVGRETTEALLPLMEKGADLAEKFAGLIERNPELLKGILTVGGGLAAAGTVVTLIAQVQRLIATVQLLSGGKTISAIGGVAAKAVGTGVMGAAGSVVGGLGLGLAGYDALAKATGRDSAGEIIGKYQTSLAYMWGKMLGGPELATKWGKAMGELTGVLPKATEETEKAANAVSKTADAQMKAYLNYVRAEREATTQYQKQRAELIRNFNQQQAAEAAEFARSRSTAMRDFYRGERQAEAEYYRSRMQAARAFSVEAARAEEAHQREMRRLQEDWNDQAEELIGTRDALGLVRGMRDYERSRRDADEQFRIESSRRSQDFARQQAEQAEQFAAQRAQRMADFQVRMADEQAAYDLRRRQAAEQNRQQLAELQQNYNEERKKRRQALIDQLRDLSEGLQQTRNLWRQFTTAMASDFRAIMASAGVAAPTRHSGGYTGDGLYRMKRGEFVLRPDVTSAAERLAGRSLNQDNVLAMLAGRGGAGKSISYTDNRHFDSRLSSQDRALIRNDTNITLREVLGG
ncbi:MAG TPA: hypothetical protein VIH16_06260 [Bellilinea sp.]